MAALQDPVDEHSNIGRPPANIQNDLFDFQPAIRVRAEDSKKDGQISDYLKTTLVNRQQPQADVVGEVTSERAANKITSANIVQFLELLTGYKNSDENNQSRRKSPALNIPDADKGLSTPELGPVKNSPTDNNFYWSSGLKSDEGQDFGSSDRKESSNGRSLPTMIQKGKLNGFSGEVKKTWGNFGDSSILTKIGKISSINGDEGNAENVKMAAAPVKSPVETPFPLAPPPNGPETQQTNLNFCDQVCNKIISHSINGAIT